MKIKTFIFCILLFVASICCITSCTEDPSRAGITEATPETSSPFDPSQCLPLPETMQEHYRTLKRYCPEGGEKVRRLRVKFEEAILAYVKDHGAENTSIPSADYYRYIFLEHLFRGERVSTADGSLPVAYPEWEPIVVEYTTTLPPNVSGKCPFAMKVSYGEPTQAPLIIYCDEYQMHLTQGDTWVFTWNLSTIIPVASTVLIAAKEECEESVDVVLSNANIEPPWGFFNGINLAFRFGGGKDFPFFTKAWLDKPSIAFPGIDPDEDAVYLADSSGNVYSVVCYQGRGYVTFNGTVICYDYRWMPPDYSE